MAGSPSLVPGILKNILVTFALRESSLAEAIVLAVSCARAATLPGIPIRPPHSFSHGLAEKVPRPETDLPMPVQRTIPAANHFVSPSGQGRRHTLYCS